MGGGSRSAIVVGLTIAMSAGLSTFAMPARADRSTTIQTFSPELASGEAAGITITNGGARFVPAPDDRDRVGLLTFPPQRLDAPVDSITVALDAEVPPGGTATVESRVRRFTEAWTEWRPAAVGAPSQPAEPSREIQVRLVLTGTPGAEPSVRRVSLTARTAPSLRMAEVPSEALQYRIFATREGLVGGTTANGHVITEDDHFVALPSRRALSQRDKDDYSVQVCAPTGRCAWAPVWDVGPWNTHDDYWHPAGKRENWGELPQGMPQAQAAFLNDFNGGHDGFDRAVRNPAGIDLADGLFRNALALQDNAWVQVTLLWTGSKRLLTVHSDRNAVPVHAAPRGDAKQVGVAANRAGVPVECAVRADDGTQSRWLQIGMQAFISADFVPTPSAVKPCSDPLASRRGDAGPVG